MFSLGLMLDSLYVMICSIPAMLVSLYYSVAARPCKSVAGEVIMVTGSAQGLGRELSLAFARLGAQLVCVDLNPDVNQETVKLIREAGGTARGYVCDVSDRTAINKLAQEVGRVDMLINNAGIYPVRGLWNSTEKEIRTIIDINLMSQFWTAQAFLPGMKDRNHGHFVSISSVAGLSGVAYKEPYSVSKAGLTGLAMCLDNEMRTENKDVKITIIYPYFVRTRSEIDIFCNETWRIPAVEMDDAVRQIVRGIRQELTSFTVPGALQWALHLNNILPDSYRRKWIEVFYGRATKSDFAIKAHDNILKR